MIILDHGGEGEVRTPSKFIMVREEHDREGERGRGKPNDHARSQGEGGGLRWSIFQSHDM